MRHVPWWRAAGLRASRSSLTQQRRGRRRGRTGALGRAGHCGRNRGRIAGTLRGVRFARRHRQRQDRGVPAAGRACRRWPQGRRALVLVPEIRTHAAAAQPFPRALRGTDRSAALRAHRPRAPVGVARGLQRTRTHCHRYTLGGVRAGTGPGRAHRGRRARCLLQAARRGISLLGARSGRGSRPARRRAGAARIGHSGTSRRCTTSGAAATPHSTLGRRAEQAAPPQIKQLDLRTSALRAGLSTHAVLAIERHLREEGQVLVFLNRRGYAPTLLCTACGWIAPCQECDARLTVHLGAGRLRCHHCGADEALPERCPVCGFAVKPVGQGTERIEETLGTLFPGVPVARLDRDVVRRRGDLEEVVARMASGSARILVGTQMVTKGHDFPNITLVVVLNADQGLFSSDFRAPERLAQTIVQVAGRRRTRPQARRSAHTERISRSPAARESPAGRLRRLRARGARGAPGGGLAARFEVASRRCAIRRARPRPHRNSSPRHAPWSRAARAACACSGRCRPRCTAAPRRYHAQLLVESRERAPLHEFLDSWLPQVEVLKSARAVRWSLDVDPIELY